MTGDIKGEPLAPLPPKPKKPAKTKPAKAKEDKKKAPKTKSPKRGDARLGQSFKFTLAEAILAPETGAVVSFLITRNASKSVAVNVAVTNQLIHDGKWPPNDVTKIMGAIPYRYNNQTMRNFLKGVETTLAAALPPFTFTWDGAFVTKALGLTVAALMGEIEQATT